MCGVLRLPLQRRYGVAGSTISLAKVIRRRIEDMSDHAVELIQGALIDIKGRKRELDVILGI